MMYISDYQVVQVVCLVHKDLHEQYALECINSLASSVLSVSLDKQHSNSGKLQSSFPVSAFPVLCTYIIYCVDLPLCIPWLQRP